MILKDARIILKEYLAEKGFTNKGIYNYFETDEISIIVTFYKHNSNFLAFNFRLKNSDIPVLESGGLYNGYHDSMTFMKNPETKDSRVQLQKLTKEEILKDIEFKYHFYLKPLIQNPVKLLRKLCSKNKVIPRYYHTMLYKDIIEFIYQKERDK